MNTGDVPLPMSKDYTTIFQCQEGFLVCSLRFFEGLVSLGMTLLFIRGYRAIMKESNNPISKEDKYIFILAMCQTTILTLYYFLFEEFFILATIRNLLIWISINVLQLLCKIYWIKQDEILRKVEWGINGLKVVNFLLWFVIAVGHGSEIENTHFNLGYNCRVMDWVILSAILMITTMLQGFIGFQIIDKFKWELKQPQVQNDLKKKQSYEQQIQDILTLAVGSIVGGFIMFVWDYLANTLSDTDEQCVELFSGNTFFRKILCFLLKIISMQVVPAIIYYNTFYRRKERFQDTMMEDVRVQDINYLDDAYSDLNRTLTERSNSRNSLFSRGGSTANL